MWRESVSHPSTKPQNKNSTLHNTNLLIYLYCLSGELCCDTVRPLLCGMQPILLAWEMQWRYKWNSSTSMSCVKTNKSETNCMVIFSHLNINVIHFMFTRIRLPLQLFRTHGSPNSFRSISSSVVSSRDGLRYLVKNWYALMILRIQTKLYTHSEADISV